MTPNEITSVIAQGMNKTLDIPFRLALMKRVDAYRSRFVRESLTKDPRDRAAFRQTIYIPMESTSEVPCDIGIDDVFCTVAKSTTRVPVALRANGIHFDYVGAIDGNNPFTLVAPGMLGILNAGKYSKNLLSYELLNDYIVVHGLPNLPQIRIDAIFDAPTETAEFVCQTLGSCNYWDMEYKCTNDILQMIIQYLPEHMKGEKLQPDVSVPVTDKVDPQQ